MGPFLCNSTSQESLPSPFSELPVIQYWLIVAVSDPGLLKFWQLLQFRYPASILTLLDDVSQEDWSSVSRSVSSYDVSSLLSDVSQETWGSVGTGIWYLGSLHVSRNIGGSVRMSVCNTSPPAIQAPLSDTFKNYSMARAPEHD